MLLNLSQPMVWHSGAVKKKLFLKQTENFSEKLNALHIMIHLADHLEKYGNLGSGETSYVSKVIYEELIHLKQVFSFIVKEMKDRKYFSISVDSTPGVSNTCQLTVIAHSLLCP